MGPRAIPEEWVRDDKVVHYLIPKTFVDWLTPKFGETGLYSTCCLVTLSVKWLLINSPPHTTDFTPSRNTISKPMAKSLNNTKKLKCKLKVKHFSINKN